MKKIMLFCSAGMSTSLLVERMKDAAKADNLECEIYAVASTNYEKELIKSDVCLLGPQVRYLLPEAKALGEKNNVPVDVIDTVAYGMVDGPAVLNHALSLLDK